ncbi:16S rRNA (adenine(1518)-N(6)/adenine(1519)-N(6))-dimethyltransferase RsmA [Peptoniphilus raoultii]|uniref:16S rRNA (adenine(1518)-N(6)/adenine(1519)-N(6))- dimethyltransferase RsmA n=1 Tax=Peptoniphilus raoultii TaxID=1776387 RepID=UPI0008D984B8|nr:16S rRNA (adenine(1518)-N(6)/adenine(1519)-N(6))-dimethyltransferase RsmA [Peptoniphilus raoultii]
MDRLFKISRLKEILNKYDFKFTKSLGQNFLIDGNIVKKIGDAADLCEDDYILEIGPGIGTLTEELSLRAKKVISVEIDEKLKELLKETIPYENVEFIFQNFLKISLREIEEEKFGGRPYKVVANLPYYITSPIIEKILTEGENCKSITVMIQREVAERFAAKKSTKDYGSLSVFIQFFSDPIYNFTVSKSCFIPKPNVDSGLVTLKTKKDLPTINRDEFFKIVRAGFSKRRKTLLNSLSKSALNLDKDMVKKALKNSNIDENRRAESLGMEEFMALYENFKNLEEDING